MVRTCCVPEYNSGKQAPRHKFPKDPVRCHEWIKSLNLHLLENLCANDLQKYRVCYRHFREEDYSCSLHNRFLLNTAIPVLHINNRDSVDTIVNNVQQQPLQHVSQKNDQHSENLQSVLTDMSYLRKQVQHHSEQLAVQQNMLETYHAQQMQLQSKVCEIQQKTGDKDMTEKNGLQQSHYEHTNYEEKEESIIHKHEKRLKRIEEQLGMITPKRNRGCRRPNLQNITRRKNLTPTARMLYDTTITLRRQNTRLKRLVRQKKKST